MSSARGRPPPAAPRRPAPGPATRAAPAAAGPGVGVAQPGALAHPHRAQRSPAISAAADRLGRDGGGGRQRGRREAGRQHGAARPRLGHDAARERRRQHERERGQDRDHQLDQPRPAERVRGEIASGIPTPCGSRSRPSTSVPLGRGSRAVNSRHWSPRVLVREVEVAVLDPRAGGEQVVHLVARVVLPGGRGDRRASRRRRRAGAPRGRRASRGAHGGGARARRASTAPRSRTSGRCWPGC